MVGLEQMVGQVLTLGVWWCVEPGPEWGLGELWNLLVDHEAIASAHISTCECLLYGSDGLLSSLVLAFTLLVNTNGFL